MKYLLLTSFVLFSLVSCDPPRNCTEPRCLYSDVGATIPATLTGNLDSIIQIGDTLHFSLNIPDTLITNYGNLIFGTLLENSFFGINLGKIDSINENQSFGVENINPIINKGTKQGSCKWSANREFDCYFVPKFKGKYTLDITSGRLEMSANNEKQWLVFPSINFGNINRHENLLVKWVPNSMKNEAIKVANEYTNKYYFEIE